MNAQTPNAGRTALAALALFLSLSPVSLGHAQQHGAGHKTMQDKGHMQGQMKGQMSDHMTLAGKPGDPAKADRTVAITVRDNYFEPEEIAVKAGETIRFVVTNEGQFLHEFNLGSAAGHVAHQKEMATMMEHGMITATRIDHEKMKMDHGGGHRMGHEDGNSVLVEPGKTAELVWEFGKATDLEFACNIPGHYDAGMMGHIRFGHGQ